MAKISNGSICIPGMKLCSTEGCVAGQGTYDYQGFIYAALAGDVKITDAKKNEESEVTTVKLIEIFSPHAPGIVPLAGDIVTAKVKMVTSRAAHCDVKCVRSQSLARSYRAVLKKDDIRATEKDRIDVYKCFRPGDIILARIMPQTELHSYQLTTADNSLGVVLASAEGAPNGVNMVPLSWTEMQCPKTLVKEPRKVARIVPENIHSVLLPNNETAS